jgi:transposase InsO family protein
MKYAWIERNRRDRPVSFSCEVLGVSPSEYHERKARGVGNTSRPRGNIDNDALLLHIRAVHAQTKGEYGWPHRIASGAATSPYIATDEGWLYLAVAIDLFSRQVVGWSMKPHMRTDLVSDALRMAWFRRHLAPGLILHSDRGSRYCSHEFWNALKGCGMRSSMSRKGDCWGNAATESLWGSLKVARLHGRRFETRRDAMDEVIDCLSFYNHRRLHSILGYVSPTQIERAWLAAQEKRAA